MRIVKSVFERGAIARRARTSSSGCGARRIEAVTAP